MAAPSMKRRGTAESGAPNRGSMRCPMFDERGPGARWPERETNSLFAGMLGLRDNATQRPSPISSMTDPNQGVLTHVDKLGRTGVGLITLSGIPWVVAQFPDGYPPTITKSLPNGRHWDPEVDKPIGFDIDCVRAQLDEHLDITSCPRGLAAWRIKLTGGVSDFTVMASPEIAANNFPVTMAYAIIHAYVLPALESDPDFETLCTVIKMDPDDVENADLLRVLMHEAAEGHPDFGWKFWTNFAFPLADMIGLSYAKIANSVEFDPDTHIRGPLAGHTDWTATSREDFDGGAWANVWFMPSNVTKWKKCWLSWARIALPVAINRVFFPDGERGTDWGDPTPRLDKYQKTERDSMEMPMDWDDSPGRRWSESPRKSMPKQDQFSAQYMGDQTARRTEAKANGDANPDDVDALLNDRVALSELMSQHAVRGSDGVGARLDASLNLDSSNETFANIQRVLMKGTQGQGSGEAGAELRLQSAQYLNRIAQTLRVSVGSAVEMYSKFGKLATHIRHHDFMIFLPKNDSLLVFFGMDTVTQQPRRPTVVEQLYVWIDEFCDFCDKLLGHDMTDIPRLLKAYVKTTHDDDQYTDITAIYQDIILTAFHQLFAAHGDRGGWLDFGHTDRRPRMVDFIRTSDLSKLDTTMPEHIQIKARRWIKSIDAARKKGRKHAHLNDQGLNTQLQALTKQVTALQSQQATQTQQSQKNMMQVGQQLQQYHQHMAASLGMPPGIQQGASPQPPPGLGLPGSPVGSQVAPYSPAPATPVVPPKPPGTGKNPKPGSATKRQLNIPKSIGGIKSTFLVKYYAYQDANPDSAPMVGNRTTRRCLFDDIGTCPEYSAWKFKCHRLAIGGANTKACAFKHSGETVGGKALPVIPAATLRSWLTADNVPLTP